MRYLIFNGSTIAEKEIYGVQRNTFELLKELDKIIEYGKAEIVIPWNPHRNVSFKNIKVVRKKEIKNSKISKFIWNHYGFMHYVRAVNGLGVDMCLAVPMFGCDVVSIYDCISERFPENSNTIAKKISRQFYMFRVKRNIIKSKLILTDSMSAKNDIVDIYKCPENKIKVIYCAWQHMISIKQDDSILEKLNLHGEYFFSLGSRYKHKNFRWIIEAAKKNPEYRFICSGSAALSSSDAVLNNRMPSNLTFAGYLSDAEVKSLMAHCKAFIQPSLYEGFGLPPLEAMSVNAKCIVSKSSSLPEIYDDSVWYINPLDYNNVNVDKIMQNKININDEVLGKFSWKTSACRLYEYLQLV